VIALVLSVMGDLRCHGVFGGAVDPRDRGWADDRNRRGGRLTRFIASWLYGVRPADPVTFAGSVAILAAVALAASLIPARSASRVDPVVALSQE